VVEGHRKNKITLIPMQNIMSSILNSKEARIAGADSVQFVSGEMFGPWADESSGV